MVNTITREQRIHRKKRKETWFKIDFSYFFLRFFRPFYFVVAFFFFSFPYRCNVEEDFKEGGEE